MQELEGIRKEIAIKVKEGCTPKEISEQLGKSITLVRAAIRMICKVYGARHAMHLCSILNTIKQ